MADEAVKIEGQESQPNPANETKYSEYYALQDKGDGGNQSQKSEENDVKSEGAEKTQDAKPEPVKAPEQEQVQDKKPHIPDWQKRINKQTAIIKRQEAELAELKKWRESQAQPTKPKLTRDNFVTEEEWIDYKAEQKVKEILAKQQEETAKGQGEAEQKQKEVIEFQRKWANVVRSNFEGDEQGMREFLAKVQDPEITEGMDKDVHDYVESSPVGARLLDVLINRPDLVEQINGAKPVYKGEILRRLESQVYQFMQSKKGDTGKAKVPETKAPKPIGSISQEGSALDEETAQRVQYDNYMKKKHGYKT